MKKDFQHPISATGGALQTWANGQDFLGRAVLQVLVSGDDGKAHFILYSDFMSFWSLAAEKFGAQIF